MAHIHIDNLSVGYGDKAIIENCSLRIEDGALFTLLGPSGCGKTTLLRTLAGFIAVRSGRVLFGNKDVTALPAHLRDVGMVFQDYALFPDKTVFDNVAYGLRARKRDEATVRQTVGEYLERVGLEGLDMRRPAELSGGQRQRVALARALAIKPTVLLMDEPLSNLDAKLRVKVRETIADLQRQVGITTVLVTHDQEEALALSNRIGLLRSGRLEQVGSPEDLYERPVSSYVADFVGAANIFPVQLVTPALAGEPCSVAFEGQRLAAVAQTHLGAGSVCLVARAEAMHLRTEQGDNCIGATVRRRQFLGARTAYTVAFASGASARVEAHVEAHGSVQHGVGTQVWVAFSPTSSLLVAN